LLLFCARGRAVLEALGAWSDASSAGGGGALRARVLAAARRGAPSTQARAHKRNIIPPPLSLFCSPPHFAAAQTPIHISATDTPSASAAQWASLRASFSAPHTALIWHGRNHYALIFAMRQRPRCADDGGAADGAGADGDVAEAESGGAGVVRELLTARKGQRPSAWVTWHEVRALMLKWDQHAIIAVTSAPPASGAA
jgi:hypothetical protein